MSDVEILDQSTPEDALEQYAAIIRDAKRSGRDARGEVIESYFTIGHALIGARQECGDDQSFNAWFTAQEFGLSRSWAYVLKNAAENDEAARRALSKQLADGTGPNIEKAVKEVTAPTRTPRAPKGTTPVAPPAPVEPSPVAIPVTGIAEPVAATDDSTPPEVDTAPDVPAPADAPFDAMRDAIRCSGVHTELIQLIFDTVPLITSGDANALADRILAMYDLTPRTETTP